MIIAGVNPLPAYGRVGQGQHFFLLAVHFAKRNTKNCGGEKARAGRAFLSPVPPFLPAPPERNFQNSQSGFSSKKVRILSKRYRHFSKFGFWAIVASPSRSVSHTELVLVRGSGSAEATILNGFLKSKNNFCPLKRKFGLPKANINLKNLLTNLFSFAFDERQSDNFKYFDC